MPSVAFRTSRGDAVTVNRELALGVAMPSVAFRTSRNERVRSFFDDEEVAMPSVAFRTSRRSSRGACQPRLPEVAMPSVAFRTSRKVAVVIDDTGSMQSQCLRWPFGLRASRNFGGTGTQKGRNAFGGLSDFECGHDQWFYLDTFRRNAFGGLSDFELDDAGHEQWIGLCRNASGGLSDFEAVEP